jgi:hypothetical protein
LPASCSAGSAEPTSYCDGAGACVTPSAVSCDPYVCDVSTCKTRCSADADCNSAYACVSGLCVTKGDPGTTCDFDSECKSGHCVAGATTKVCCSVASCAAGSYCGSTGACVENLGQHCSGTSECGSGFCVDGVCCDGVCDGQCEACDLAGSLLGHCSGVKGPVHGTRTPCFDGGGDPCKALACDGSKDRTKCATYEYGLDKECVAASCKSGTATSSATCDGAGTCKTPTTSACAPYVCDAAGKACKTSCTSDADCAPGDVCDVAKATCVPAAAKCSDDGRSSIPPDKSPPKVCDPYRCDPSTGNCFSSCATSDQCAPGDSCVDGACVPPAAGGDTSSSGGCAYRASSVDLAGWPLLFVCVSGLLARRRRRHSPRGVS